MIDPTDWFDTPKSILLGVLQVLTLGRYPEERLGGVDEASSGTAFIVEIVGLVVLALGIWWLAGEWH